FNPKNPYGRNYYKSTLNKKKLKKLQEKQKKEEKKLREKEKEAKADAREDVKKQKEKERKERAKQKEKERKQRAKERERARKNKAKISGKKTSTIKEEQPKSEPVAKEAKKQQPDKPVEEQEEITEKKKEEPKKEKDETAYNEGLLWLAKTYIKRQNYFTAEYLLNKLEATRTINKNVAKELPSSFASIYIKQKNYPAAIQSLEEAIRQTKDKERKARYLYIMGQLQEQEGNYAKAFQRY